MRAKPTMFIWIVSLLLSSIIVKADNSNYPVKIKMNKNAIKAKKGRVVALATVMNDVVNDEGQVIINKNALVYGTFKKDKKSGLIYFEFLYISGKGNKRIPVRGYIIKQVPKTSVGATVFRHIFSILFFPLLPFVISDDIKALTMPSKFKKSVILGEKVFWITTQ